jgi:hypothetical protein
MHAGRNRLMMIEWAFAQSSGNEYFDRLETANAPVANQFAGQAKSAVAALLRSGLKDRLVISNRFYDVLAFVNRQRERFFAVRIFFRLGGSDVD